jgi:hypothetical protein
MWTLFKLFRWAVTGLIALWLASAIFDGGLLLVALYGSFLILPLALLWVVPAILRHRAPAAKKHDPAMFKADVSHDNIALDFGRDKLWIRDPVRGERYLSRGEILNIRTNFDAKSGIFRQRLEFQIRDMSNPLWQVLFQRHSDRWKSTSQRNGEELTEWFARASAWFQTPQSQAAKAAAAGMDMSLPGLHRHYYEAANDLQRQNFLVAFDITCNTENLDQKAQWEGLGGTYPGPSPELLRMQSA